MNGADLILAERNVLLRENAELSNELSACKESPGGCGYWREAAKLREQERDRLKERLLQEIELARSWMKKYDARQDAIRIAEQRARTLERALGQALQSYAGPAESMEALNDVLLDVPQPLAPKP